MMLCLKARVKTGSRTIRNTVPLAERVSALGTWVYTFTTKLNDFEWRGIDGIIGNLPCRPCTRCTIVRRACVLLKSPLSPLPATSSPISGCIPPSSDNPVSHVLYFDALAHPLRLQFKPPLETALGHVSCSSVDCVRLTIIFYHFIDCSADRHCLERKGRR
ncbi:hypothetical protein JOM56_015454 [Amanita muscaria]